MISPLPMHAYIYRTPGRADQNTAKTLLINDKKVAFFIEPLELASKFSMINGGKRWHLRFFEGSPFPQQLEVRFDCEEREISDLAGRACWLNNGRDTGKHVTLIELASQFLRESKTLPLSACRELTQDRALVADRDGIVYFSDSPDQFERIVLCQSLAIAYTQVFSQCMAQLTQHVKGNAAEKTLALYEDILRFNAADYFSYPVELDRHELSAVWDILRAHYKLDELSQELTEQLSAVANLLRAKREQERDQRDRRLNLRLTVIGVFFTIVSMLSLVELRPTDFNNAYVAWHDWVVPGTQDDVPEAAKQASLKNKTSNRHPGKK